MYRVETITPNRGVATMTTTTTKCTCTRCGYEWEPRKDPRDIRQCPRCKSPKWAEPRKGPKWNVK